MKTASGKWIGFDPEMMEAFAKSLNVKLVMLDTKWDGIIPSLLTAKCDIDSFFPWQKLRNVKKLLLY